MKGPIISKIVAIVLRVPSRHVQRAGFGVVEWSGVRVICAATTATAGTWDWREMRDVAYKSLNPEDLTGGGTEHQNEGGVP